MNKGNILSAKILEELDGIHTAAKRAKLKDIDKDLKLFSKFLLNA